MSYNHEFIGLNTTLFLLMVSICLFFSHFLKQYSIGYLSASGSSMLFGLFIGGILSNFSEDEIDFLDFNSEIFYYVLLPPIIFEAGFTLKRKQFFKNINTIMLFAVVGTFISTLVVGLGLYGFLLLGWVPLTSVYECLLFGALISAVDPVGTLAILGKKEMNTDPMLYSLIFGEAVLNDAVSIVLYDTIENVGEQSDSELVITFEDHAMSIVGSFLGTFIASFFVGCAVALICASIFKNMDLNGQAPLEFSIFILFSYGSYASAEIVGMSGIVSVFFCGILMGHYAWYNVSQICQVSLFNVVQALAEASEAFVYAYLGITAGVSFNLEVSGYTWSVELIVLSLLLCLLGRALNIFPLALIANIGRKRKISFKMQVMMWFAGLRGAIAFALAITVPSTTAGQPYIVTTTLFIVFFTTLLCGGTTERALTFLDIKKPEVDPQSETGAEQASYTGCHKLWKRFDERFMKVWFGGNLRTTDGENDVIMTTLISNLPILSLRLEIDDEQLEFIEEPPLYSDNEAFLSTEEELTVF